MHLGHWHPALLEGQLGPHLHPHRPDHQLRPDHLHHQRHPFRQLRLDRLSRRHHLLHLRPPHLVAKSKSPLVTPNYPVKSILHMHLDHWHPALLEGQLGPYPHPHRLDHRLRPDHPHRQLHPHHLAHLAHLSHLGRHSLAREARQIGSRPKKRTSMTHPHFPKFPQHQILSPLYYSEVPGLPLSTLGGRLPNRCRLCRCYQVHIASQKR